MMRMARIYQQILDFEIDLNRSLSGWKDGVNGQLEVKEKSCTIPVNWFHLMITVQCTALDLSKLDFGQSNIICQ